MERRRDEEGKVSMKGRLKLILVSSSTRSPFLPPKTHLLQLGVLLLLLSPKLLHLLDAYIQPSSLLDELLLSIQPQTVRLERRVRRGGGRRAKVILIQSHRERRVGGEDELGISLAPVLYIPRMGKESKHVEEESA